MVFAVFQMKHITNLEYSLRAQQRLIVLGGVLVFRTLTGMEDPELQKVVMETAITFNTAFIDHFCEAFIL